TGQALPMDAGSVYAVGDFDSTQLPEVRLLFARELDARRYLDVSTESGSGAQWMEVMPVYLSYDDCPPHARYAQRGPESSRVVWCRTPPSSVRWLAAQAASSSRTS